MKERNLHGAREPAGLIPGPTSPQPWIPQRSQLSTAVVTALDVLESVPLLWPAPAATSISYGTLPGIMAGKRPPRTASPTPQIKDCPPHDAATSLPWETSSLLRETTRAIATPASASKRCSQ